MRTTEERMAHIIEKAKIKERERKKKRKISVISAVSIALALILAVNLTLFIPYTVGGTDLSVYKNSEYYPLIKKIDELTSNKHTTNNFKEWGLDFTSGSGEDYETTSPGNAESDGGSSGNWGEDNFSGHWSEGETSQDPSEDKNSPDGDGDSDKSGNQEVTNNQVKGVIEGDLFKRSNDHIWYLRWSSSDWNNSGVSTTRMFLSAYSIQGYESERVSDMIIDPDFGTDFVRYNDTQTEMYLSADAKTVTIFSSCYKLSFNEKGEPTSYPYNSNPYTVIISIDVSNPSAPRETARRYVSGGLVSSRLVDGTFLLVTEFRFTKPDFSKPEEFLPQTGTLKNMRSLPMNDIVLPENANTTFYSILSTFHEKSLERMDSVAFFSGTYAVYVSQDHIFTARSYYGKVENNTYSAAMSEIFCISYRNGLELKGSFSVEGTALNQYSFDEKDGVLRVFTTSTRSPIYPKYSNKDVYYEPSYYSINPRCNLFCVRLSDFTPVATILDFAPEGESIRAVRFSGNKAYVCTAVYNTDPVFEFDLSDYSNITSKDTGTISGFSMNLAKFYGDTLIGIGYGESQLDLKIEIYGTDETSVASVAKYELENVDFFTDFKEYFLDRERGLIGFTIYEHIYPSYSYRTAFILLRFNGESLEVVLEEEGYYYGTRACIVGDYIYILDGYNFTVKKLPGV